MTKTAKSQWRTDAIRGGRMRVLLRASCEARQEEIKNVNGLR
jgi:hypothetical protein